MGQVTVTLNGRSYRLACADGEEERLKSLVSILKQKLDKIVGDFGQIGETRLMLMSALLIADELLDSQAACDVAREAAAQALRAIAESQGAGTENAPILEPSPVKASGAA